MSEFCSVKSKTYFSLKQKSGEEKKITDIEQGNKISTRMFCEEQLGIGISPLSKFHYRQS